ncbi:GNAT family N-acetyltransferase [Christensenellaceae bacterium 44-20]
MEIRKAQAEDFAFLSEHDGHIAPDELEAQIERGRILIAQEGGRRIGWLRWNLFWDNTPFLNLLFLMEEHRKKGYGRQLMQEWERRMAAQSFGLLMTSTLASEQAQHFYRALGYRDAGSLLLEGEALEIIFTKELGRNKPCLK